ncbi:hypothetical protein DFH09DRAFT_1372772 [Mycena vulgaris]|nr:hypothetical protein DFH09DRAFT_1372772 [Mycena vulgaris]
MIPEELVNAIFNMVEDTESVKACTLVSSRFCSISQPILIDSLNPPNLGRPTSSSFELHRTGYLITESPHITVYIKHISIELPIALQSLLDPPSILPSLAKFTKVQQCVVGVAADRGAYWTPAADLLRTFPCRRSCGSTHPPALSFSSVFLRGGIHPIATSVLDPKLSPVITKLVLGNNTESVCNLVGLTKKPLLAKARAIKHLRVLCLLPILPSLSSLLSFALDLHERKVPRVPQIPRQNAFHVPQHSRDTDHLLRGRAILAPAFNGFV